MGAKKNMIRQPSPTLTNVILHIKSGWSIEYIEGSRVKFSIIYCLPFSEDRVCLSKQCIPLCGSIR